MNTKISLFRCTRIRLLSSVILVGGATIGPLVQQSALAQQTQVQIEWKIPSPQVEDVQKRLALAAQPVPGDDKSRGQPLFYLFDGATALSSVVDAITSLYRDVVYGGVVIDACNDRLEIHNEHSIPDKVMVVRCTDKDTPLYISTDVQSDDLVKVLSNAMAHK